MIDEKATNENAREELKKELEGYWEYKCEVTSKTLFEMDETGRGGRMFIIVSLNRFGVGAEIDAERLWKTTSAHDDPAARKALAIPVHWRAKGGVLITEKQLSFRYTASDVNADGETTDMFVLETATLTLLPGEFEHRRNDRGLVTGTVRLRKMADIDDLVWVPKKIPPASRAPKSVPAAIGSKSGTKGSTVITVFGDQATIATGHQASASAIQIQIAAGDVKALGDAFTRIGVPTADVEEITAILRAEEPGTTTFGTRAAEWVGRMVSKGLTGAWKVGKDVSVEILSEMLLRFYGMK